MWQATNVQQIIEDNGYKTEIVKITSDGDRSVGGDLSTHLGQFTSKIDDKLVKREIDIAVHSSKDVPVDNFEEIVNLAYLTRGSTSDIILFNKSNNSNSLKKLLANNTSTSLSEILDKIPEGAKLGTASVRRQALFFSHRNDVLPIAVRGKVETRIEKLISNNFDALILAEAGLKRLENIDCLTEKALELESYRISSEDWPTAPGQGAISVHCLRDRYEELENFRILLNDNQTELDVELEKKLLFDLGGGCQYPVGMESIQGSIHGLIAPNNWRELYSTGNKFTLQKIDNESDLAKLNFVETIVSNDLEFTERKIISTLNSDRLQSSLNNVGIPVNNVPVIKLEMMPENWPEINIDVSLNKSKWPILILTSPFAAKAASEMIEQIPNLQRMMWLAIGEGTARACFRAGNPASICSDSRNKDELFKYILENIHFDIPLYIPMSNLSSTKFVNDLKKKNYIVSYWDAYANTALKVKNVDVNRDDVLLISSPSSAKSWISNNLPIPDNILCMGDLTKTTIEVLEGFNKTEISVLDGPTYSKIVEWWEKETED